MAIALAEFKYLEPTGWKGLLMTTLADAGVEDLGDGVVAVPYRLPDGTAAFSKLFVTGKSWYDPAPSTTEVGLIPFGLEQVPWDSLREDDILIVAEGESDTLACREHIAEIGGRRVFCIGLPGSATWRSEWLTYLQPFIAIYVIPDGDDAGRRMAWSVRSNCHWARLVELPEGDDLRALLQRDGAEALLPLLDKSTWLLQLDLGWRACSSIEALDAWMRRRVL